MLFFIEKMLIFKVKIMRIGQNAILDFPHFPAIKIKKFLQILVLRVEKPLDTKNQLIWKKF
jgi:hypothetical protein